MDAFPMGDESQLEAAQCEFLRVLGGLPSERDRRALIAWIERSGQSSVTQVGQASSTESRVRFEARRRLAEIAERLKTRLPLSAVLASEQILAPAIGSESASGLRPEHTAHLDAFLYDELDEERLISQGHIPKSFCSQCGSRDIQEISLITHSLGRPQLEFVFTSLLPELKPTHRILDVGSRLGSVLYGAALFTPCQSIVGVEMNGDFCDITRNALAEFDLVSRVQVVHAELSTVPELVQRADVIVLHNVFEWFMPVQAQTAIWQFLRAHIPKHGLIVASPRIEESLASLHTGIDTSQWLRPLNPARPEASALTEAEDESDAIFLYQVVTDPLPSL